MIDVSEYKVTIEFQEDVLGSQPKNKEVYAAYIATKAPEPEKGEEEVADVAEIEARGWTGFATDEKGPHLWDYQVKGFLSESARCLKEFGNLKQLRDKVKRFVFVMPRRIYLPPVAGVNERSLRAETPQGPRIALARSDYVKAPFQISFELHVLKQSGITLNCIKALLDYGRYMGISQWRTASYGRMKVISITSVND